MNSLEIEKNKFGIGEKLDQLQPLIDEMRRIRNEKNSYTMPNEKTLGLEGKDYKGIISMRPLSDSSKLFSFVSDEMDIRSFSDQIEFYFNKPDENNGITSIKILNIPGRSTIICEFLNGLLSRDIDIYRPEKSCFYLGSITYGTYKIISDESFKRILEHGINQYKNSEFTLEKHGILSPREIPSFVGFANKILSENNKYELTR